MEHKQLKLNQALLKAVKETDVERAEKLLQQGADPLGSFDQDDLDQSVLHELFIDVAWEEEPNEKRLELLRLFLNHGMDISTKNEAAEYDDSLNPVWLMAHLGNEGGIRMLKMLLDHGLDAGSVEILFNHIFLDMGLCDEYEIYDELWMEEWAYPMKMMMLVASYPHVLEASAYIRKCVEVERNNVSCLPCFRDWNRFAYEIDLSTCDRLPHGLRNAPLHIRDKKTGDTVWTMFI